MSADTAQAMVAAAKAGDLEETTALLRQPGGTPLSDVKDQFGSTPLHWAAAKGHGAVAKALLNSGASVSVKNDAGDTPLHWSAMLGKPELVDILLNYNADIYEPNKKGIRPIDVESTPLIKSKLLAHKDRLEDSQAAKTAETDRINQYVQRPTSMALSQPSFDAVVSQTMAGGVAASGSMGELSPPPPPEIVSSGAAPDNKLRTLLPSLPPAPAPLSFDIAPPPPPPDKLDAPPPVPANFFSAPPPPPPTTATPTPAPPARQSSTVSAAPPLRPAVPPVSRTGSTAAASVASLPKPSGMSSTRLIDADDDDDDGGDDDDDKGAKPIEFWDAQEEMQYQKMLIHFGKDMAEKALVELRRVREKKGEVPPWKRPAAAPGTPAAAPTVAAAAPAAPAPPAVDAKTANREAAAAAAAAMATVTASAPQSTFFVNKLQTDEDRANWEKERTAREQKVTAKSAEERKAEMERALRDDASYDYVDGIKKAIDASVNLDAKDDDGMTALMVACAAGHKKATLALLKGKAKRNLKNKMGHTALHLTVAEHQAECLRLLIKYKAKVDVTDKDGRTPLMYAGARGDLDAVKALLEAGTNVDRADKSGKTVLMLAAFSEQADVVAYLLQIEGITLDLQDKFGWSVLMFAAHSGSFQIARMLLSQGAATNLISTRGKTASQLAYENGHTEVYNLLESNPNNGSAVTLAASASVSRKKSGGTINRRSMAMSPDVASLPLASSEPRKGDTINRAMLMQQQLDPDVNNWNELDVGLWLLKLGDEFAPVVNVFRDNNINGRRLARLNDEKLQQLGVSSMGLRDDILEEINNLTKTTRI